MGKSLEQLFTEDTSMKTNHRTIHREDYTEPDYYTPEIRMSFELNPESDADKKRFVA